MENALSPENRRRTDVPFISFESGSSLLQLYPLGFIFGEVRRELNFAADPLASKPVCKGREEPS